MMPSAGCSWPLLIGLVIVASSLGACATGGSEGPPVTVCPTVVDYDQRLLERAADELGMLPDGSAIEQMLVDYAVMRAQGRVCRGTLLDPLYGGGVAPCRTDEADTEVTRSGVVYRTAA